MQNLLARVASVTLLIVGSGVAVSAAPSFLSPIKKALKVVQDDPDAVQRPYNWSSPSIIQSGSIRSGVSFLVGDTYANYSGRTFELKQEQLKVGIENVIELYYGRQFTLAKGRSQTSRFHGDADYYGARVLVKKPTEDDPSAWSVQIGIMRPGQADLKSGSSQILLDSTKNNMFAVNYGDRAKNQFQLAYSVIEAPAFYSAHSISLGVGRDFTLRPDLQARLQLNFVGQSFKGGASQSNYELKTIGSGSLAYSPMSWLSLEGNLTVMPNGMPFESGDFTGVSGFAVYEPGGIVDDLRTKFLAFGSLRLVAHWSF